jgi:hypothetical protein
MSKPQKQPALAPEDEVLRRMLHTQPTPHKVKTASKSAPKKQAKKANLGAGNE